MPELPEVQTIVADLNRKIQGDTITGFWSDAPRTIKNATVEEFRKAIIGKKIILAHRIGKNMFVDLTGGKTIYIHLKMTGHLLVKIPSTKSQFQNKKLEEDYFSDRVNQYVHHVWHLGKNKTVEFSDMRKFAKIVLLETKNLKNYKDIVHLGVDAMSVKFTLRRFGEILDKSKKTAIGILLMDQDKISGIGNIYRSEILFDAGVRPGRKAGDISPLERKAIHTSIGKVLRRAIRLRGTSDSDYRDTSGAPGGFQDVLAVYRRHGKRCSGRKSKKCDTMIVREKLGGRSAFYCPNCQK